MRRVFRGLNRLALAGVMSVAVLAGATESRAQATADRILPGNTLAYIQVESASQLRAALKTSQFGQLLADPAMKPVLEDVEARLEEASKQARARLGLSLEQILELPQGPVTLAIVPAVGKKLPVSFLIGVDAGAKSEDMAILMRKLTELGREDGGKVTTEDFNGLTITQIEPKNDTPQEAVLAWTVADRYYILSLASDLDAMKDVIANGDGREDSMAANGAYKTIMAKTAEAAQATWFLNIQAAFDLVGKTLEAQGGGSADQIKAQLQLTGLDGLKAAGGAVAFNSGPFDTISKTFVYAPGDSQGLLRIFSMPEKDLSPESWVPASVAGYQSVSWDLDDAYTAINDLAETFAPGVLAAFEQQLGGPQGDGLKFERDLFGPLGDRFTVITDFKKPITETSQRTLVAVELDDAAAFQKTLNKIFDLAGATPKTREFQGSTIYDIDLPDVPNAEGANLPGSVSVTIAKDHAFLSSDVTFLEQILRGSDATLAQDADYQAVAKHFPSATTTAAYQKPEDAARLVYNMVKSGQLDEMMKQSAQASGNNVDIPKIIDPDKLPDFEVFTKYLTPSGSYGKMDPDGAIFTQFSLKK